MNFLKSWLGYFTSKQPTVKDYHILQFQMIAILDGVMTGDPRIIQLIESKGMTAEELDTNRIRHELWSILRCEKRRESERSTKSLTSTTESDSGKIKSQSPSPTQTASSSSHHSSPHSRPSSQISRTKSSPPSSVASLKGKQPTEGIHLPKQS